MTTVLRATLEAVISSQERLRQMLDRLAERNQPINSEAERQEFMHLLSYSTLGFGSEVNVYFIHNSETLIRKDVETTARWLSYQRSNEVTVPITLYTNQYSFNCRIGDLWECLRNYLFSVYPIALKHAASMSKEQEGTKKATGYSIEVSDEDKEKSE